MSQQKLFKKVIRIYREKGLATVFKMIPPFLYERFITPFLPRTTAIYNGVEVRAARYFDSVIPWKKKDQPEYESGLACFIEKYVKEGDRVTIVGGGWGVTAVKAGFKTGNAGKITVYEGSAAGVNKVKETLRLNNVSGIVKHGIVGSPIKVYGETEGVYRVSPDELQECDVLELDCEGSELEILNKITIRPRIILVETHGMHGASSDEVKRLLKKMSYSIEGEDIANSDAKSFCLDNDVKVVAAERK